MGTTPQLVLPHQQIHLTVYSQPVCTGNIFFKWAEAGTRRPGELCVEAPFSFAGMGVVIDVTKEDIDAVKDPENWILQRKVKYADVIKTPDEPAKAEIRLFYFWKEGWERPKGVHNLAKTKQRKNDRHPL